MFIEWNDTYKLGIPSMDADHKALVDLMNRFFHIVKAGGGNDELDAVLVDLITETQCHFAREEGLLDHANYPGLPAHRAEHDRLLEQLSHFIENHRAGGANRQVTMDTADFLHHWLLDHIQHGDRPYRPYVMKLA